MEKKRVIKVAPLKIEQESQRGVVFLLAFLAGGRSLRLDDHSLYIENDICMCAVS